MGRYRGRHAAARYTEFTSGRLRRGVSSAAIAAAAMAALTASQAPGIEVVRPSNDDDGPADSMPDLPPGDDSYHTELPPLRSPAPPQRDAPGIGTDESGIPATMLAAYKKAERSLGASDPGCNLPWELLAAIGKVESGHARGGAVDDAGTTLSPILGPQLNGQGFARIQDTDGGAYDGDSQFDRAVGPMQFIPSTWTTWGADGNGDGEKDPNNVFDAALAAGAYLCHGERDLAVKAHLDRAILSYNHSRDYLNTVLAWLEFYRDGVHKVPDGTGVLPTSPGAGSGDDAADRRRAPKDGSGGANLPEGDGDTSGTSDGGTSDGGSTDGGSTGGGTSGGGSTDGGTSDGGTSDGGTSDGGSTDGGTSDGGSTDGGTSGGESTDGPTEPAPDGPAAVQRVGDGTVTVHTGDTITDGLDVRVLSEDGAAVPGAEVRYVIADPDHATDAQFAGGASTATVSTDENGLAAAPDLSAGQRAGTFAVRASVVGHDEVEPAQFTATVEAKADTLQRSGSASGPVTAQAGEVCPSIQISATNDEQPAAGVAVEATLLAEDGTTLEEGTGPYFAASDEDGRTHTLQGLRTNRDGKLVLPDLHAGSRPGTYELKLTAEGGGTLVIAVEITEAQASGE